MWFKFPDGVDQISVEQQVFIPEHEDKKSGGRFFRAPDHFAATILGQPGFERVQQPEGAPEDFPKEDPRSAKVVDELSLANQALQQELVMLRQENKDLAAERDGLKKSIENLEDQLDKREAEIDELKKSGDKGGSTKPKGGD